MSYVQVEPIVVKIDRLDLVLEENDDFDTSRSSSRYIIGMVSFIMDLVMIVKI